jgi:hypothetical protein
MDCSCFEVCTYSFKVFRDGETKTLSWYLVEDIYFRCIFRQCDLTIQTWVKRNSQFRCIRTACSWRIYNTTPWMLRIIKCIELYRRWCFINGHFQEHQKCVERLLCAFSSVRNCFSSHWGTWSSSLHCGIWNLVPHLIESLWYKRSVGFIKSSARLSRFFLLFFHTGICSLLRTPLYQTQYYISFLSVTYSTTSTSSNFSHVKVIGYLNNTRMFNCVVWLQSSIGNLYIPLYIQLK